MKFELEYMQPALGRAYAIILMLIGSSVISFSGLVIRGIQEADTWQINFYRSLAFAISIIMAALVRIIGIWFTKKITASITSEISLKAYKNTLYQPYSFHVKNFF